MLTGPERSSPNAPYGRRPTITDVARAAGVSIKTVSRVVNNEPTRPETAERVLEAVRRLGFRRNDMASNLRSGRRSASVGLIIEDLGNPFYSAIASAVEEVARSNDTMLITASSEEDSDRERQLVLELCKRRVDGVLVVPAGDDHRYLRAEIGLGTPVVFVDRPPGGLVADTVLIDNAGGARAAVRHLLDRGHRRIALLVDNLGIYTARERLAGAHAALAEVAPPPAAAGSPPVDSRVCDGLHDPPAAAAAVAELLDGADPPTAFFCSNNRITVGAVEELWRRGDDAAVVGFDDFELSHLLPRPVTIVGYDVREIGRRSAELLFARIAGSRAAPVSLVLPTTLAERGAPSR